MFTKIRMREEKGFTLIELLIVVAIIGILAAIAIPQFAQYRRRGYSAAVKSDLKNMYTAAQAYLAENPTGTVAVSDLSTFGYKQSGAVSVTAAQTMTPTAGAYTASSVQDTTVTGSISYDGQIN